MQHVVQVHVYTQIDRPCHTCLLKGTPEQCVEGSRKIAKYLLGPDDDFESAYSSSEYNFLGNQMDLLLCSPETLGLYSKSPPPSSPTISKNQAFLDYVNLRFSGSTSLHGQIYRAYQRSMAHVCPSTSSQASDAFLKKAMDLFQNEVHSPGTPALYWNFDGLCVISNKEFQYVTGIPPFDASRKYIYELLDDNGLLQYYQQLAVVANDLSSHSFSFRSSITTQSSTLMKGVFWVTLKRDPFESPLALLGHFLPTFD